MLNAAGKGERVLRESEIAALRRRLLLARHRASHVVASPPTNCHSALVEAYRTYVADVQALLDERRALRETIAALRRVAVAAEAALAESRAGQQGKRAADLVRAPRHGGSGKVGLTPSGGHS